MSKFRDQFAIVGVGVSTTREGGGGRSGPMMEAMAVREALRDAGLKRSEIDGAINVASPVGTDSFSRKMGLKPSFYFTIGRMAGSHSSLWFAAEALRSGKCKYISISLGIAWLTQVRQLRDPSPSSTPMQFDSKWGMHRDGGGVVDQGWIASPGAASIHAFYASRHMHEFGTTHEQLGAVAISQRKWANLNPEAQFYDRTLEIGEYMASRWVSHPYRLLDNCVVSDVGCAFIVTTADRARHLRQKPVYIKGVGLADAARKPWWDKTNFTETDGAHSGKIAMQEAGVTVDDIDVAQLYDCFTGEMIVTIEDYGFCAKGDGGPFVESGATMPGGSHPMNTHGGLLSAFHCGDQGNVIEAVRQLRGDCGDRQVAGAEIALADGHGWEMLLPFMCPMSGATVLGSVEG